MFLPYISAHLSPYISKVYNSAYGAILMPEMQTLCKAYRPLPVLLTHVNRLNSPSFPVDPNSLTLQNASSQHYDTVCLVPSPLCRPKLCKSLLTRSPSSCPLFPASWRAKDRARPPCRNKTSREVCVSSSTMPAHVSYEISMPRSS